MRLFWGRKVNVVTGITRKSSDSGVGWQGREEFEGFVVMCQQGGFGRFGVCFWCSFFEDCDGFAKAFLWA